MLYFLAISTLSSDVTDLGFLYVKDNNERKEHKTRWTKSQMSRRTKTKDKNIFSISITHGKFHTNCKKITEIITCFALQ